MVHFVGAGPGAPDLITRRGAALLQEADCIIYAGSLVNPALTNNVESPSANRQNSYKRNMLNTGLNLKYRSCSTPLKGTVLRSEVL